MKPEEYFAKRGFTIWGREPVEDWTGVKLMHRKPVAIFAPDVEEKALGQFEEAMLQDWVEQGALMPDVHTGYTLPIGAVIATRGVLVPSYVGYDIGCGMLALPLTMDSGAVRAAAPEIHAAIHRAVPTGYNVHSEPQVPYHGIDLKVEDLSGQGREVFEGGKGFRALGTLGGGNHFIEVGSDNSGRVWIIIHSGSRGPGHNLASHYMAKAAGTEKAVEGHFPIEEESALGRDYWTDLDWMLRFALENRQKIADAVLGVVEQYADTTIQRSLQINRNHNHAERQQGGLWIHRKGATHAEKGMRGVIPGNMRDGSYIVTGLGNPRSMSSSSHGAGRVMGRYKAKKRLDVETFTASMKGIISDAGRETLDEDPRAYKPIEDVMALQSDLVTIDAHVRPILNVKG